MNCKFKIIPKNQLHTLKVLWGKLNEIHLKDSHCFTDHYSTLTFDRRCVKFYGLDDNKIRIELVVDNEFPVGYCISTVENEVGEIESIYLEEKYREFGFGTQLIENSKKWLYENNCSKIIVTVAEGHESVFGFYQKHGFYPKFTCLEMKDFKQECNSH
jgi:diamine N-acetyltransferase